MAFANPTNLSDISILVVEDDYFVAVECADTLRAHGARVLGPVPDATRARALVAGSTPDCVLLDVNLKGSFAFGLAEELIEHGIPTIFTTGYDASILPPALRGTTCLQKPVDANALVDAVRREATGPRRRA